jgi:hypothetical protein
LASIHVLPFEGYSKMMGTMYVCCCGRGISGEVHEVLRRKPRADVWAIACSHCLSVYLWKREDDEWPANKVLNERIAHCVSMMAVKVIAEKVSGL